MLTEDGYFISKCLDGETEAFGFLVDKYKASVYAFLYSRLRNFHDAEDVTQRVFVRAYEKLGTLSSWESFARWLYTIAYSQCRNFIRECQNRPDREFMEDQNPAVLRNLSMESYRDAQVSNSLREELEEAMASLPEMYSQILILHYFGGMRVKEIATVLSITPTNVRKRLSRARAMLREEMLAMMDTAFEGQRLQASFTFRIVESIKRVKPQLTPRATTLPWGLSLAAGIMATILGIGSYLNLSKPLAIPKNLPITSEMEVFRVNDIIINAPEEHKTVINPDQHWTVNDERPSELQKAPLLAPQRAGIELKARDLHEGDSFGMDNCIYGEYAIVGAPWADNYKGIAYIFKYNGTTWVEEEELVAGDGADSDHFGLSVAITNEYAIVGTPLDDDMGEDTGSVYIFRFEGGNWIQEAKLKPHGDTIKWCYFGYSISISGDYLVVGSRRESWAGGAIYIFQGVNGKWEEQAKLISSDWARGDNLGYSVSISGDYAIAGAPCHANNKGSAYIFKRDGDKWKEQAILVADDGEADDWFGTSVSISGNHAIVGANGDKDKGDWSGSAYIFYNDSTSWKQQAKLVSSDLATGDAFGAHTCISGDYALVGATAKKGNTGAAYSFERNGTFWEERAKITLDNASSNMFGYAISISGDNAIIGAPRHNSKTGAAYIYSCKADLSLSVNPASHTITTFGGTKDSIKSNITTPSIEAKSSAPMEFRLLQNYPNPFNPETWIPYQLRNDAHVKFSIYDSTGNLVQLMDLGHKPAGSYMEKDKAIYWDGRNEAGEPVSSGTYFIHLSADSFSSTRKMVMIR